MDIRAWLDDHIFLKIPWVRRNWEARRDKALDELLHHDATYIMDNKLVTLRVPKFYPDSGYVANGVKVLPVQRTPQTFYGSTRQTSGLCRTEQEHRQRGREWLVDKLPDECVFM